MKNPNVSVPIAARPHDDPGLDGGRRIKAQRAISALLSLSALAFSGAALAADSGDCESRIPALLKAAYPDAVREADGKSLRLPVSSARWIKPDGVVCKVWPASPDKTLLAVRLEQEKAADFYDSTADLELLVAETVSPKITHRLLEPDALVSDAVRLIGMNLDTARYRLDEHTMAFGVSLTYSGSSRPNPFNSTDLSLYVLDGTKLRPVLRNLRVETYQGDWDTRCAGEFKQSKRTIAVGTGRGKGYADLTVTTTLSGSRNVPKGEECQEVDGGQSKSSRRLSYDGREYAVPADLRGL